MKSKIVFAIVLVALMMGCSKEFSDNDFLLDPPESFDALMAQGWSAFYTDNYDVAVETFSAAAERKATYPEVYLGLGWSNIRDLNLENGRIYLGSALSFAFLDEENGDQIILDAKSGLAGIALIEGDYAGAIAYVDEILAADPGYTFEHDESVNLNALKRIRMTAAFYTGGYSDAFQEVLELGLTMENVVHETPLMGDVSALAVMDSGATLADGTVLTAKWLKVTAPAHNLEADDYVVLSGLSDGGDASLTALVESFTRGSGLKVKYVVDADNILVTSLSPGNAALVGAVALSSPKFYEGTGMTVAIDGGDLTGMLQINVYNGRQLVHVNSVTTLVDDGAVYSVTEINEGATGFQIFGNPVIAAGQRVAVDYYHTNDFGLFLSELIDLVSNIE